MKAMVLTEAGKPLELTEMEIPTPAPKQVLIKIAACGICRTDLHVVDGELPKPELPLIPGHQIVGYVAEVGTEVKGVRVGERVGLPWLGGSCGQCDYCRHGQENLCSQALYTGYQINGGYAEYCVADYRFIFRLPKHYSNIHVAPLLCAGLIGYRALSMVDGAKKIGFYGFGASAHLLIQIVKHQGGEVYAFTKKGHLHGQEFAKKLGAIWAGDSDEEPPSSLDAAIIFAPVGALVPQALKCVRKGGSVICAGIHMSDIPSFPYHLLWEERILRSVANLTRKDGEEFFALISKIPLNIEVTIYPLERANEALTDLRLGRFNGAAVLSIARDDPFI